MCAKAWARCSAFQALQRPGKRLRSRHAHLCALILIPRLRQFTEAYPEIDLALQVSIPLLDVVAEDADLMVRFGPGHYADVEHIEMARDVVTPLASPALREHGPFERPEDLEGAPCCAARWSPGAPGSPPPGLDWPANEGSQFNDIGLMCDAAAAGMGVALVRLKLGAPWLDRHAGAPVRPDAPAPRPLPVLAHRHHGPLGMRGLCRVAAQGMLRTGPRPPARKR
jgi:DNA-binding transcriptional LysR family regulator